MATELYLVRTLGGFRPADAGSQCEMESISVGDTVKAVVTQPRNLTHHRKYWALINAIFPHQDTYATKSTLHAAIKVALGYGEQVKLADGRTIIVPGSIKFSSMDQREFEAFFERVVQLIVTRILPGVDRADLDREVGDILAGRAAA